MSNATDPCCAAVPAAATRFLLALTLAASTGLAQTPLKEPRFELVGAAHWQANLVLSRAGDVDADGFDDVIVGFPADPANNWGGSVRVHSGRDGASLIHLVGSNNEAFGASVASAGDMNHDGYDDILIGVPFRAGQTPRDRGVVLVMSGPNLTLQRVVAASQLLSTRITHCQSLGARVAGVGDVDGDGYRDFMATATLQDPLNGQYGGVFVLSGRDGHVIYLFDDTASTPPSQTFGSSIAGGGDIDGDGVEDLLVGDFGLGAADGAVLVYSGATGNLIWTVHGATSERLGSLVSDAGDVDGDGKHEFMAFRYFGGGALYSFATRRLVMNLPGDQGGAVGDVDGDGGDDFIVGNRLAGNIGGNYAGAASVISGATLRTIYWFAGPAGSGAWLGSGACGAGDVNGDGFADFMFTAADSGSGSLRATRVYLGGPHAIERFRIDGDSGDDYLGRSVSGAGDVNGDGFDDVIVGAYGDDNNGRIDSGSVRLLSGRNGALLRALDGDAAGDRFGFATSGAGDVNGDGFADVIVGAHGHAGGAGMARVISGLDGRALHTFYGAMPLDGLGYAVSGVGDLDGDGYDDLLVGAYGDDTVAPNAGAATVYSGRTGAPLPGHTHHGAAANDYFGIALRGVGDVNRDGVPDFIVGAHGHDTAILLDAGLARVISGKDGATLFDFEGQAANERFGSRVSGAGDVDRDGYADLIVGTYAAAVQVARVYSGRTGLLLHAFVQQSASPLAVGAAGDVNGDGYDDVMVGVTYPSNSNWGLVRVHSGFDGGVLIHQFADGVSAGDGYGISLGTAGDTDGDGFDEVVVGASLTRVNGYGSGSAFVYGFEQHRSTVLRPGVRRAYGAGCVGGNQRLPRIGALDRPAIGRPFAVTLRGGPTTPASVLLFLGAEVAVPLGAIGMPDCTLLATPAAELAATTDALGTATGVLPIPTDEAMLGVQLGMQWIVLDAAAPRGLPLSLSDGLRVIPGR